MGAGRGARAGARAGAGAGAGAGGGLPGWLPAGAGEVREPAARAMLRGLRRAPVAWGAGGAPGEVSFAGPAPGAEEAAAGAAPLVLLHGFDSNCLEYRRLHPLLGEAGLPAYAVDILGWGWSRGEEGGARGPREKREFLRAFWEEHLGGRPVTLVGSSLGGAMAIDCALEYPDMVQSLVLIDAQGFIDGLGPLSQLPGWVATLGVKVLGSRPLREMANQMSYHDAETFATDDAVRVGQLHCSTDNWMDDNKAWMMSGGYSLSERVAELRQPTLVCWGEQDRILEPSTAEQFRAALTGRPGLPDAQICTIPACGHVAHLEQPQLLTELIVDFARGLAPSAGSQQGGEGGGTAAAAQEEPSAT